MTQGGEKKNNDFYSCHSRNKEHWYTFFFFIGGFILAILSLSLSLSLSSSLSHMISAGHLFFFPFVAIDTIFIIRI